MKIAIRTIEFRGYTYVTTGTGVEQLQRILILCDRQANAAAPTVLSDYLSPASVVGLRNLAARKRFKTILDRTFDLNASGESGSWRKFHYYLKLRRPLVVEYNTANNGTVADIVSNSLYLVTVGSSAAGATAGGTLGTLRIRYTDQ